MTDPPPTLAYFAGKFVPATEVAIPYWDWALASGATVSEHLRTRWIAGRGRRMPFRDRHFQRFARGLQRLQIDLGMRADQWSAIAEQLLDANGRDLPDARQLGVCFLASPGAMVRWAPRELASRPPSPWLLVHTYDLPAEPLSLDDSSVALTTSRWQEIPAACVPKDFKHRSRLHYYLAEQEAAATEPGSRPLFLDAIGNVSDASTAALLVWTDQGWVAPPNHDVFASVTLAVIEDHALGERIAFQRRPISLMELRSAAEVVWGNTPNGLRPVTRVDGQAIGDGQAGPRFRELNAHYLRWAQASV